MLISTKYNFVFLCNPKCASTSIESMLEPYCDIKLLGLPSVRHTNYRQYIQYVKPYLEQVPKLNEMESICVIREPLSWLSSWHRFRGRTKLRDKNHPQHMNSTYGMEFSDFVEAYITKEPPSFAKVGSQFGFMKDTNEQVVIDKIFLLEDMDSLMHYMSQKIGVELVMHKRNVSSKNIYKSKYISKANELFSRKIKNKFKQTEKTSNNKENIVLPDELMKSLRRFIPEDFEIHEKLKNNHTM